MYTILQTILHTCYATMNMGYKKTSNKILDFTHLRPPLEPIKLATRTRMFLTATWGISTSAVFVCSARLLEHLLLWQHLALTAHSRRGEKKRHVQPDFCSAIYLFLTFHQQIHSHKRQRTYHITQSIATQHIRLPSNWLQRDFLSHFLRTCHLTD